MPLRQDHINVIIMVNMKLSFAAIYTVAYAITLGIFCAPVATHADALGVSPSTINVTIAPDSQEEFAFVLSRSNTTQEQSYEVRVRANASFIYLPNDMVHMPSGAAEVSVPFVVDTTDTAIGSYSAILEFLPVRQENGSGLRVEYSLATTVSIDVTDDPQLSKHIQVSTREVVRDILTVTSFVTSESTNVIDDTAQIEWQLTNTTTAAIYDIPYHITVYHNDRLVQRQSNTYYADIMPGNSTVVPFEYTFLEPGSYTIELSVADIDAPSSFSVRPGFNYTIAIVIVCTCILISLKLFHYRKQHIVE